jgi:hypothetical protein
MSGRAVPVASTLLGRSASVPLTIRDSDVTRERMCASARGVAMVAHTTQSVSHAIRNSIFQHDQQADNAINSPRHKSIITLNRTHPSCIYTMATTSFLGVWSLVCLLVLAGPVLSFAPAGWMLGHVRKTTASCRSRSAKRSPCSILRHGHRRRSGVKCWSNIVDADFEAVLVPEENDNIDNNLNDKNDGNDDGTIAVLKSNSLLDLALQDNNVTFPFVDPQSQQTIICRLAVTADLDDQRTYAIGIPSQHGVLMVIERNDGTSSDTDHDYDDTTTTMEYLDPDVEDNVEVLEIMAGALQKYLGEDLKLQRTPRILTIAGDLDKYVDAFPASLVGPELTMEKIMEEPDGDLDKLFEFFQKQFGHEEFEKAMAEATDLEPNLQKLFEMDNDEDDKSKPFNAADLEEAFRNLGDDILHQGVGVKLVGFQINNIDDKDKTKASPSFYSLVKPVKPLTVVGRLKESDEGRETIFELLTPEEEALIVPRLEQVCKEDMESQGIRLSKK